MSTAAISENREPGWGALVGENAETHRVAHLIRLTFYTFIASIPFDLPERPIPVDIPTLTCALFLLTTLLQPGVCYRRFPKPFWYAIAFFAVLVISSLLNGFQFPKGTMEDILRCLQALFTLWAGYNLMRDPHIATAAIATLSVAGLVRALLQLGGIATTASIVGRMTVFGQDENASAGNMVAALLILIGLAYARPRSPFQPRFVIWPFAAMLAVAIVQTGSRGGMVALLAGLFCFVLGPDNLRRKLTSLCVVLAAVIALAHVSLNSEMMRERWRITLEHGDLAKREELFPIYMDMFYDKPLIGWGPYGNTREAARRLRLPGFHRISPHNLPQEILTSTGLIGTIPLSATILACAMFAWHARRGVQGTLPLALLAYVMVHNLSIDLLRAKLFWLILTYACACGSIVVERQKRLRAEQRRVAALRRQRAVSPNACPVAINGSQRSEPQAAHTHQQPTENTRSAF